MNFLVAKLIVLVQDYISLPIKMYKSGALRALPSFCYLRVLCALLCVLCVNSIGAIQFLRET